MTDEERLSMLLAELRSMRQTEESNAEVLHKQYGIIGDKTEILKMATSEVGALRTMADKAARRPRTKAMKPKKKPKKPKRPMR